MALRHLGFVAAFLCAAAIAGCGGSASSPTPATPTPEPTPTTGVPSIVSASIPRGASDLTTTAYVPNPITVSVGTTVTWLNNDNVAHTVSSQNNLWDSGGIQPGAAYSRTFQSAGTFAYYCVYHPRMLGTVTVQ
jgi:plastocyanin